MVGGVRQSVLTPILISTFAQTRQGRSDEAKLRTVASISWLLTHSFIHLIIHSVVHPVIRSLIRSFIHSFVQSVSQSFTHSFIHSFIHSPIHPSIQSVSQSVCQSVSPLVIHSPVQQVAVLTRLTSVRSSTTFPSVGTPAPLVPRTLAAAPLRPRTSLKEWKLGPSACLLTR